METRQTPPPTPAESKRSLERERRKALLIAAGMLRNMGRQLMHGIDAGREPEPYKLPNFETVGEEVAVGSSLLALANRLEPDRQLKRQRHE